MQYIQRNPMEELLISLSTIPDARIIQLLIKYDLKSHQHIDQAEIMISDLCNDRFLCRLVGVKDYSRLPAADYNRIKLAGLYLTED